MGPSIHKADQIICVSGFTLEEVSHFFPDSAKRCQTIHEAAEAPEKPLTTLPGYARKPYLLFVGTLEPRKNLSRVLEAYASLTDNSTSSLVLVGGQGWGDQRLEELVAELGLQDRVTMPGFVTDTELNALYEHAQCLLMPSIYEGFGLPALEAMQHGTPVIFSSNTSLEEVVGEGGLAVNPESTESIASAIREITQKETRTVLSRAARERASRFSWEVAARDTLKILTGD